MTSLRQLVKKVKESNGVLYFCFEENGVKRTLRIGVVRA